MYSETNSLQRLPKEIRYYLFKDIYIYIDIENALFTFLYRFVKGYFLKSPVQKNQFITGKNFCLELCYKINVIGIPQKKNYCLPEFGYSKQ